MPLFTDQHGGSNENDRQTVRYKYPQLTKSTAGLPSRLQNWCICRVMSNWTYVYRYMPPLQYCCITWYRSNHACSPTLPLQVQYSIADLRTTPILHFLSCSTCCFGLDLLHEQHAVYLSMLSENIVGVMTCTICAGPM